MVSPMELILSWQNSLGGLEKSEKEKILKKEAKDVSESEKVCWNSCIWNSKLETCFAWQVIKLDWKG